MREGKGLISTCVSLYSCILIFSILPDPTLMILLLPALADGLTAIEGATAIKK